MSFSDDRTRTGFAGEPDREAVANARALLAAIEERVFPGSNAAPLYAQATPIRQVVTKLFANAG